MSTSFHHDPIHLHLRAPTERLLEDIARSEFSSEDVAGTYAMALQSETRTDWIKVNQAIMRRWGINGLALVKQEAKRLAPESTWGRGIQF